MKSLKHLAGIACGVVKAVLLAGLLAACERATPPPSAPVPAPAAKFITVPAATGAEFVTLDITPPAGNAGKSVLAALEQNGRAIVARGSATVAVTGTTEVVLRKLDPAAQIQNGACELWLVVDRDGMPASHPSFGDWYRRDTWHWPQVARTVPYRDPHAWQFKSLSSATNLVTVHYHRFDGDYANVGLWSWDAHRVKSPEQNELLEVGRDEFGLIFQFDRADYGSDTIGLVPRLNADWARKDGDDKFWRPDKGNEIWLIGGQNRVWTQPPDIGPQVVAAFIDAPDRLVVEVSRVLSTGEVAVVKVGEQVTRSRGRQSNSLAVTLAHPLDLAGKSYAVSVDGLAGSVLAVPRGILDDAALFGDQQAVLGATVSATGTTFRVFAPTVPAVQVVLYDAAVGVAGRRTVAMTPAGKGIWEVALAGDLRGKFYMFGVDGREVLDPYAVNAVDSSRRALIVESPGWNGPAVFPRVESPVDMVVYEMHVRDFTIASNSPASAAHRGKYAGFAEAADHLVELGVTHVQLLPVQDFENDESGTNYNWGYVTMAYNSPEGWFASNPNDASRGREFKQLVAALHARGIGVILDVVYNHTAGAAPFQALVPRYYYRWLADGSLANGSGCGNEFRTESPMGRKFVIDTLTHWVREYDVDGFRFDLMALVDSDTMRAADQALRRLKPGIVLYGEPWSAGPSPLRNPTTKAAVRGTQIGAFNDEFRNAVIGSPFDHQPGFVVSGANADAVKRGVEGAWRTWASRPDQAINYLSCHDNRTVWDRLKLARPGATPTQIVEMMKVGYLLLFTAQGVPLIHGGEEFGRNKQGHENSYNAPDAINAVDWSLKQQQAGLFAYVRDLIALRKAHPVFRLRAKEQIAAWLKFRDTGNPDVLCYTYAAANVPSESWQRACVIVNVADHGDATVTLPPGAWRVAVDQAGAQANGRPVTGVVTVRYKSGMVLYQ